jgi:predicted acetyltransferase
MELMNPDLITPVVPGELRDQELQLKLKCFRYDAIHKAPSYDFRMMHAATAEEMGSIRLRVGSTSHIGMYAGHVGYSVDEAHRGHHYASRSVRLLMPLARLHGLSTLWITCDPENAASRRCLEIAGAEFVEIVNVPPDCVIHKSGHPRKCRYRLDLALSQ